MASVEVLKVLLLVLDDLPEIAGLCVIAPDDLIKVLALLVLLVDNVLDIVRVVVLAIAFIDELDDVRYEPKREQRQLTCTQSDRHLVSQG